MAIGGAQVAVAVTVSRVLAARLFGIRQAMTRAATSRRNNRAAT